MQYKIFISYTLRDKQISLTTLKQLKKSLSIMNELITFIDVLDNKNVVDPQKEVCKQIKEADIIWVINSKKLHESKWVTLELSKAKEFTKPICYIALTDIINIIKTDNIAEINTHIKRYLPLNKKLRNLTPIINDQK